ATPGWHPGFHPPGCGRGGTPPANTGLDISKLRRCDNALTTSHSSCLSIHFLEWPTFLRAVVAATGSAKNAVLSSAGAQAGSRSNAPLVVMLHTVMLHAKRVSTLSSSLRLILKRLLEQTAHWKAHRPRCREIKKYNDALEAKALTERVKSTMVAEMDDYLDCITDELTAIRRTAYRLGRSDACEKTHTLDLTFMYHAEKPTIRERFQLTNCEVTPTSIVLQKYGNNPTTRIITQAEIRAVAIGDGLGPRAEYKSDWLTGLVSNFDYTLASGGRGRLQDFRWWAQPPQRYNYFGIPVTERTLNPNWQRFLNKSLSGPQPRPGASDFEDLVESEGQEEALRLARASGRLQEVKRGDSELLDFEQFRTMYSLTLLDPTQKGFATLRSAMNTSVLLARKIKNVKLGSERELIRVSS
ncbi:hypothetical protein P7C70_g2689, partial [Phenoliferia sp. Uapishka_3]